MIQHDVGAGWVWFTDYVYWSAVWTLNSEGGRLVDVGIGISFRGKPRGKTRRFENYLVFKTYGIGAIHVRSLDGKGPCRVRLDQSEVGAIPIYGEPNLLEAAINDAKRVID